MQARTQVAFEMHRCWLLGQQHARACCCNPARLLLLGVMHAAASHLPAQAWLPRGHRCPCAAAAAAETSACHAHEVLHGRGLWRVRVASRQALLDTWAVREVLHLCSGRQAVLGICALKLWSPVLDHLCSILKSFIPQ